MNFTRNLCLAVVLAGLGMMGLASQSQAQVTSDDGGVSIDITTGAASAAMHAEFDATTGELLLLSAGAAVGSDTGAMASPTFSAAVGTTVATTGSIDVQGLYDSYNSGTTVADQATVEFTP
jgi:hypothetical protein